MEAVRPVTKKKKNYYLKITEKKNESDEQIWSPTIFFDKYAIVY